MAQTIEYNLSIIEEAERGEDVRDAIVDIFRTLQNGSICEIISKEAFDALSEEEKNNGKMYFISGVDVEDGETCYYGDDVRSNYVIISASTAFSIAKTVRRLRDLTDPIRLYMVPYLLSPFSSDLLPLSINKLKQINTGSYIDSATWVHATEGTGYVVDIYEVREGKPYFVFLGGTVGNRFRAAFFTEDPETTSEDLNGVSIITVNNPSPYMVARYVARLDGYIAVEISTEGDESLTSYLTEVSGFA